ncbi:MAG: hypothetical protein PHV30_09450 [Candidatus Margulisbacteria bacterium]|nr:hypothetical protein [Candidatus Margulisiibacteriota bacterium]
MQNILNKFLFFFMLFFFISPVYSLVTPNFQIEKSLSAESLTFESYQVQQNESMTVGGFTYQRFFDKSKLFWGGTGYGALLGDRGGYFIGGFILGYDHYFSENFFVEPLIFVGGGGGHGAPQGGGGILRPSIAVGYLLTDSIFIKLQTGYIDFINGQIKSWLTGFTIGYNFYDVYGR